MDIQRTLKRHNCRLKGVIIQCLGCGLAHRVDIVESGLPKRYWFCRVCARKAALDPKASLAPIESAYLRNMSSLDTPNGPTSKIAVQLDCSSLGAGGHENV